MITQNTHSSDNLFVEDKRSEGACTIDFLFKKFKGQTCYFITLNPYKKDKKYFTRYQKVSSIGDILRRRTSRYWCVREHNTDGTSHFHAIAWKYDMSKPRIRGADVHVTKIETGASVYEPPEFNVFGEKPDTPIERVERKRTPIERDCAACLPKTFTLEAVQWFVEFLVSLAHKQRKATARHKRNVRKVIKEKGLRRVIQYCLKENPQVLYQDYCCSSDVKGF